MGEVPSHRRWVYDRCYSCRRGLKESFVIGVEDFIQTARQYKYYALEGGIRCPCIKCECTRILKDEEVKVHLYKKVFMSDYWIWTFHGEEVHLFIWVIMKDVFLVQARLYLPLR